MAELIQKSVSDLIKYENNSRTHDDDQLLQIVKSITEFGFTNPILISKDDIIIAGHGRLQAAKMLDMQKVPCIVLDHLTDTQIKAYVIADNQIPLNAGWDLDMLKLEVSALDSSEFNLDLLGFEDGFLDGLLEDEEDDTEQDEDSVPDVTDEHKSMLGDVWILGEHRLMCGDSTSVDSVEKLLNGQKSDLIFTDPPYGMSYDGGRSAGTSKKGDKVENHGMIKNDDLRW